MEDFQSLSDNCLISYANFFKKAMHVNMCVVYVFVCEFCACVLAGTHAFVPACVGWRLNLGILLHHYLPCFFETGLP